jgi:hypothetical protein
VTPSAHSATSGSRARIVINARALGSFGVRFCFRFCNITTGTWIATAIVAVHRHANQDR